MDIVNLVTPYLTVLNFLEAMLLVLSVVGQEFISKRNRRGFLFWTAGNLCAIALFFLSARPLMVILYIYFSVKCIQGLHNWRRLEEGEARANEEIQMKESADDIIGADMDQLLRSEMGERVAGIAYAQLLGTEIVGHIELNSCAGMERKPVEAPAAALA